LDLEKRYLATGSAGGVNEEDLTFLEGLNSNTVLSMAEKMFKQGILLEPDSSRFYLSLACCYIRQAEADAASEILAKLKQRHEGDVQAIKEVIDALLVEKAYDHAQTWIKEALNRFPQEIALYILYSRYYKEQNRPFDAITCLKRSLTVNSRHAESMVSLAELYEGIREYSDAIMYYEKALELVPEDQSLQEKLNRVLKLKYKR
jgi:tetratricopeptide (TPR) repeat protein